MSVSPASIAIVGTGRVAQAFGRLLTEAGTPPAAVGGRTSDHVAAAAAFIGGGVKVQTIADIARSAGRVLIAVSDDAITHVARELAEAGMSEGIALHTSGAHGPQLLQPLADRGVSCGVLHPLQTIADPELGAAALRGASYGVGGSEHALEWGREVVAVAGGHPLQINAKGFGAYHAGAVMASNAVIAAIDAAVVLFQAAGIDRPAALRAIQPLCLTSARNALERGPEAALTGPVQRGDIDTIRTHIAALTGCPRYVGDLYRASAHALLDIARRRGLSQAAAATIEAALDHEGAVS
jgi:predicted short-subunit dehydrogenase-like oxidoreductase (DUF2520 family)